jgi:hypothetical protein
MSFDPSGSVFVVFRKAATGANPVAEVTGGEAIGPKGLRLRMTAQGLETWASKTGEWTLTMKSGQTVRVKAANVPAPIDVTGEWEVTFPVKGSAKRAQMPAGSWTDQRDEDVKYFSGTATYKKAFVLPVEQKATGKRLHLDLGDVRNLARVRLNGQNLGVLWKAPYVVDITREAVPGPNELEIEVTNTWDNRLAGDAGKPREQRTTFVSGRGFGPPGGPPGGPVGGGQQRLFPAGLLGPVRVTTEIQATTDL